jgi:hypothetical protein
MTAAQSLAALENPVLWHQFPPGFEKFGAIEVMARPRSVTLARAIARA